MQEDERGTHVAEGRDFLFDFQDVRPRLGASACRQTGSPIPKCFAYFACNDSRYLLRFEIRRFTMP
jgi:hypothetical protein